MLHICIPTYNRSDQLGMQLRLLLKVRQLGADFGIHIFDNASTDDTVASVRALFGNGAFELVSNEQNLGFNGNILRVLHHAQSHFAKEDFFWILSDDDFINVPSVDELVRWLDTSSALQPVIVPFLSFRGKGLEPRPRITPPDVPLGGKALFELVNDTTLISSWVYPVASLTEETLAQVTRFKANEFLQLVLIACALKQYGGCAIYQNTVGFEFVNTFVRFNLPKVFAHDRPEALGFVLEMLKLDPGLASHATRVIAKIFARRSLTWLFAGDMDSSNAALATATAIKKIYGCDRATEVWLLLCHAARGLARLKLLSPFRPIFASRLQTITSNQKALVAFFRQDATASRAWRFTS